MKLQSSKNSRRIWVCINYLSVIVLLTIFYFTKQTGLDKTFLLFELVPLGCIILSFWFAYGKTRVWKLTHASSHKLDERQVQIVYKALSRSYTIFIILVLVLIYFFSLSELGPIDVILAASLIYLAHILPGSILAWTEKEI